MKLTNSKKSEIQFAIKNKQDISELIKGYELKDVDLSGSVIKTLDISNQDVSGVVFAHALIGTKETEVYLNNAVISNCNFMGTYFPGVVMARRTKFRNCNFTGTYFPYVDYCYAIFRNCSWCDAVFRIGTRNALGAQFDKAFFGDLAKHWELVILSKYEYEQLKESHAGQIKS